MYGFVHRLQNIHIANVRAIVPRRPAFLDGFVNALTCTSVVGLGQQFFYALHNEPDTLAKWNAENCPAY